ncbi:MAG: hypothetical protein AAF434_17155 [Pseudomonadota bacterium]
MEISHQEFIERYGDVEVEFSHYYKFSFTFKTELDDGAVLSVSTGGDADEIYREEIANNEKRLVRDVCPYEGSVRKDGSDVCRFYDF